MTCRDAVQPVPSIPLPSDDEQAKLNAVRLLEENLWVEEFVARLNGFSEDATH
ncbi:MAG: hypothetical protein JWR89_1539 [Tardiphaga sp.]|jgi:hypothetical protein|uniref:hypothetical protein n=1 Tax=Tardiphaga sp. TaxID=1926292 RepID=UPI00260EF25D|nr:hypothetical protein [Tardiphaga sp.]MDB5501637.1 hypothetical protein [Tardiphaga sp.]